MCTYHEQEFCNPDVPDGDGVEAVQSLAPDDLMEGKECLEEWCKQFGLDDITSSPLRVAGASFKQPRVGKCKVGDKVNLVPEPENEFDQHAMKVQVCHPVTNGAGLGMSIWCDIGYVPKDCCLTVKEAIRRPDYKGCRIAKMGIPTGSKHVGIHLALLFEKGPPDLYAPLEVNNEH